ncbi:S24 family peptidase [Nemorincola caseinilytica]
MSSILERINKIAEHEKVTISSIETRINASKGVLSRSLRTGTDISSKWLTAIVENYPLYNAEWLLTGRGEMLRDAGDRFTVKQISKLRADRDKDVQRIPLYPMAASAGIFEIIASEQHLKSIPIEYIHIPRMPECDGAVPITGDSMYPLIKSGDIVLFKEVHDKTNIIWGEMYLAAIKHRGDSFFFSKYIQKAEREGYARFVSANSHHQPVEFPIDSIRALAIIKATIRFQSSF